MNSVPDEPQIEVLLKNLHPEISSRLEKRLASAPWTPRAIRRQRALTAVYLAMFLIAAFISLTPQGHAIARTLFEYFTRIDKDSFSLPQADMDGIYTPASPVLLELVEVTPQPVTPGSAVNCSDIEAQRTYACEIQKTEKKLGLDLKEFSSSPYGWSFAEIIQSDSSQNDVRLLYQASGGDLILREGFGNFPADSEWEKVPASSAVQNIKIGEYDGEYVAGYFSILAGAKDATWASDGATQRIRWKEAERWFEVVEFNSPGATGYMNQQALTTLAAEMVYQPNQLEKIDPHFIPNAALAGRLAGFKVKEPTLLPKDLTFDYAAYDPNGKSVTLIFGHRSLRIVQTPIKNALITNLNGYKNVETVQVGDAAGQFGISPTQKTIWDSATPPTFPIDNSYSVLLWQKDDMIYQIYFDQDFSAGGYLTKYEMIRMAESLR